MEAAAAAVAAAAAAVAAAGVTLCPDPKIFYWLRNAGIRPDSDSPSGAEPPAMLPRTGP